MRKKMLLTSHNRGGAHVMKPRMAVAKTGVPCLAETTAKMGGIYELLPSAQTARATASMPTNVAANTDLQHF